MTMFQPPAPPPSPGALSAPPSRVLAPNGLYYVTGLSEIGTYAGPADLFALSIPVDDSQSYPPGAVTRWLQYGTARINEWLTQRFQLPLSAWSDSIVWANCEIAYLGLARLRGVNTDSDVLAMKERQRQVDEWLRAARDHEITPAPRLVETEISYQPIRYLGPTLPA
jgi:hypothetical protein